MNYLKIIIHFTDNAPFQDGFKSYHHSLFYSVIRLINKNGWRKTKIDLGQILCMSGLSKPTYIEARKWLIDNKWIEVTEGKNAYQMAEFFLGAEVRIEDIVEGGIEDIVEDNIFTSIQSSTNTSTISSTLPIYNKLISNKGNKLKEKYKKENESGVNSNDNVPSFVEADRQKAREAAKEIKAMPIVSVTELRDQLKSDIATCERYCATHKITLQQMHLAVDNFSDYLILIGDEYTRIRFRSHFTNWLPLNLDKVVPKKTEHKMVY